VARYTLVSEPVEFSGTGRDPKDGIPTNFSLVWYSDINGVIGTPENAYRVNEDVYAAGSGFTPTNVDIYVVPDQDWDDGDQIPQDITGAVETVSVNNGNAGPVLVWHAPLTPGRYDIVIDANQNGVYDAHADGLDSGSPGFVVVADAPPTPPVPVPAIAPIGISGLIGLLCSIGTFMIGRKFNYSVSRSFLFSGVSRESVPKSRTIDRQHISIKVL